MKKLLLAAAAGALLFAQNGVDESTAARIRSEEAEHSQLMHTLHMLTDRYGPRVTGTPGYEAAAKYVVEQFTKWGFHNVHLEPWDFGHPGWTNERASGFLVSPVKENLKFEVLAWTASTPGTVTASTVEIVPPQGPEIPVNPEMAARMAQFGGGGWGPQREGPMKDEFAKWLAGVRGQVKGKAVLVGRQTVVPVNFNPLATRRPEEQVWAQYDPGNPNAGRGGRGGFGGRGGRGAADPNRMTAAQASEAVDAMLLEEGAVMRINDAARGDGVIVAQQNRAYDPAKTVPTVILRNDDYGRIERLLADGDDVKVEFDIVNKTYPEGKTSYNVITEIPGTDKADEIVMMGGHLDSWHAATGATDNAIGSAIMIEAARLIQTLGLKPRRTIRVTLWSGEEEGLLGSLAYVKQHFGSFEDPKPEFAKLDCYFNVDTGTGRLLGASVFGPPEAAAALRPVLGLFRDWGMAGAMPTTSRTVAGTDHTSFNNAGLPGIGMQQDPIEYNTLTHHTNLDTYERIIPEDVTHAAVIISAAVWDVANQDRMIPRLSSQQMPAPVTTR